MSWDYAWRVAGLKVYTKAFHAESLVECSWRYRSTLKKKEVSWDGVGGYEQ